MKCEEIEDKLIDKFYGEINGKELYNLEQHLAKCEKCKSEEERLRKFLVNFKLSPINVSIELYNNIKNEFTVNKLKKYGWLERILQYKVPAYQLVTGMFLFIIAISIIAPRSIPSKTLIDFYTNKLPKTILNYEIDE